MAGERVGGAHAVDEGDDVGVAGAVDVGVAGVVDVGDAGGEGEDVLVVASQDGQPGDEGGGEGGGGDDAVGLDDVASTADADGFLEVGGGAEDDVQGGGLSRLKREVGELDRGEGGQRSAQAIAGAGEEAREAVDAVGVGDSAPLPHRQGIVAHHDGDAGKRMAGGIQDLAAQLGGDAGKEGKGPSQRQGQLEKPMPGPALSNPSKRSRRCSHDPSLRNRFEFPPGTGGRSPAHPPASRSRDEPHRNPPCYWRG